MKEFKNTTSTILPEEVKITKLYVFVSENIIPIKINTDNEQLNGYQYDLVQYTKEEYINKLLLENNSATEEKINRFQLLIDDFGMSILSLQGIL